MTQLSTVPGYLRQCAETHPADSVLLDSLADAYFGRSNPLHTAIIRKTLIAAVARAMNPGCNVEAACVLVGRAGIGKTRFWQVLGGGKYAHIGSPVQKDDVLRIQQSWIVEWEGIQQLLSKNESDSPGTAFITTSVDRFRPPYGTVQKRYPRPSIIVGTHSLGGFDEFPSGSRHLWVIPVAQEIPISRLVRDRDRIWAAAYHAYLDGETWTLPKQEPITNINHLSPLFSTRVGGPAHRYCWYEAEDGQCYLAPKKGMDVERVFPSFTELCDYLATIK
jgi:predicted P-loop ATPase